MYNLDNFLVVIDNATTRKETKMKLIRNEEYHNPPVVEIADKGFIYCFSHGKLVAIGRHDTALVAGPECTSSKYGKATWRHIHQFINSWSFAAWYKVGPAQLAHVDEVSTHDKEEVFYLLVRGHDESN